MGICLKRTILALESVLSNLEVIEAFKPLMREMRMRGAVEHLPERSFDVKANVLDSTKLQAHTGWKAQD